MHGSVALLDGPTLLAEHLLSTDRRSAQTLAPAIVEILKSQQIEPRQIKLVATTTGPGSFTGLRVGVTAAKTFAYAAGAEVIGISTLEAIAHGQQFCQPGSVLVPLDSRLSLRESTPFRGAKGDKLGHFCQPGPNLVPEIHAILDAQRKELFIARFLLDAGASAASPLPPLTRLTDDHIVSIDDWLASLKPGTIVAGAGLNRLIDRLPPGVIVDAIAREPRAAIVGQLAFRDYQSGRRDDLWKLSPVYLRPSYAEEKAHRSHHAPRNGSSRGA
jgi:tRNA threonylcarbamoyladenosine biosynthesis protein TsaB